MKNLILLFVLGIAPITSLHAQVMGNLALPDESTKAVPIDNVQFIAQYEMTFIQDTLNPQNVSKETMVLKIGGKISQFYSYTRFVTDSLMKVQMENSGGRVIMRQQAGPGSTNQGAINYKIYKNHPDGKVTTLERIGPNRFLCEEVNERPQWEVLPDTMVILGYLCQKATCRFKGRDYEAWFAPGIPRSDGPWKLHGLPGLILKADDAHGHYSFECTGMYWGQPDEKILFGADDYEPVSRKDLNKTYERFAADPVGFITSSSPNIRIMIRTPDGNIQNPKNTPYNPIEKAE